MFFKGLKRMSKLKLILLKLFTGYIINTVAVLVAVFIIHHRFNFNYDDAILICGFAVIILGFLITRNYEHTLPPILPVGNINSGIGGRIMHTAMVESALKDYEHHNKIHKKKPYKLGMSYFIFYRSRLEMITYGLILIIMGLIIH